MNIIGLFILLYNIYKMTNGYKINPLKRRLKKSGTLPEWAEDYRECVPKSFEDLEDSHLLKLQRELKKWDDKHNQSHFWKGGKRRTRRRRKSKKRRRRKRTKKRRQKRTKKRRKSKKR